MRWLTLRSTLSWWWSTLWEEVCMAIWNRIKVADYQKTSANVYLNKWSKALDTVTIGQLHTETSSWKTCCLMMTIIWRLLTLVFRRAFRTISVLKFFVGRRAIWHPKLSTKQSTVARPQMSGHLVSYYLQCFAEVSHTEVKRMPSCTVRSKMQSTRFQLKFTHRCQLRQ